MKITVLGSGTSSGVPVIGCTCKTCLSSDPKDKRMRASIYIELGEDQGLYRYILIDSGPDFREQALRFKLPRIDAVLYTHSHADHIFGIDDLRIYNFRQKADIPVFADKSTGQDLKRIFNYCFSKDPEYEGGGIPSLIFNEVSEGVTFSVASSSTNSTKITPIKILHGKKNIIGYRINDFAYLTDCSLVPQESLRLLEGVNCLILSGLRNRPHKTHFTIMEAVEFAKLTSTKSVFLTHLSHEISHKSQSIILSELSRDLGISIELCYDGLTLNFSNT